MKLFLLVVFAISAACSAQQQSFVRYLNPGPIEDNTPMSERKYRNMDPRAPFGIDSRITGGSFAYDGQIPFQAAVTMGYGNGWYGICGGTLISNEWILTAAHCVDGNVQYIEIGLGSVQRNNALTTSWAYEIHINGNWNPSNLDGDIALLKILWVDYHAMIAPAVLPSMTGPYSSYVNDNVTASGWGAVNDSGDLTNDLKYTDLIVVDNTVCGSTYGPALANPAIICVATNYSSTCGGDSGGPLVKEGTSDLIGVVSFGAAAGCTLSYPVGFTRVNSYVAWISLITGMSW